MNKYIKPSVNVVELATETELLTVSTDGLSEIPVTYGGDNDGTHSVGSKAFTSESLWEDEED